MGGEEAVGSNGLAEDILFWDYILIKIKINRSRYTINCIWKEISRPYKWQHRGSKLKAWWISHILRELVLTELNEWYQNNGYGDQWPRQSCAKVHRFQSELNGRLLEHSEKMNSLLWCLKWNTHVILYHSIIVTASMTLHQHHYLHVESSGLY